MHIIVYTAFVLACFALLIGCEIDSVTSIIRIDPDSGVILKNQSITLTAYGGYNYQWSLSEGTWGTLNTRRGSQVIYTSLYEPTDDLPAVQVITVVSAFSTSGSDGAGTNSSSSTSVTYRAESYITHLPSSSPSTNS